MSDELKLRGTWRRRRGPYPLAELPPSLAVQIGRHIVHRLAVGMADITGDDFGGIFAQSISGNHRQKPLGIADVTWNGCAWSIKTVKGSKPFTQKKGRAIFGKELPIFLLGIQKPISGYKGT